MSRRRAAASALALALGLAAATACGSSGGSTEAAADPTVASTTTVAPTTTTSTTTTTLPLPPGGRRPTEGRPLRVLLAGDSLMADISLAVASTLQDGGRSVVRFVAAPSIPREPLYDALWQQQLREFDPEVIVILIGVWEGMAEDALATQPLGSIEWERAYRDQALVPYVQLLTSRGAQVLWVGMPPGVDAQRQLEFSSMNRAVRQLARERSDLTYVPGDELVAAPGGEWADVLPGPDGQPQRVRRLDTTHLCADGAVRLARPVLRWIRDEYEVPLVHDWPHRNWRWVFPPEECPPP